MRANNDCNKNSGGLGKNQKTPYMRLDNQWTSYSKKKTRFRTKL